MPPTGLLSWSGCVPSGHPPPERWPGAGPALPRSTLRCSAGRTPSLDVPRSQQRRRVARLGQGAHRRSGQRPCRAAMAPTTCRGPAPDEKPFRKEEPAIGSAGVKKNTCVTRDICARRAGTRQGAGKPVIDPRERPVSARVAYVLFPRLRPGLSGHACDGSRAPDSMVKLCPTPSGASSARKASSAGQTAIARSVSGSAPLT